MTPLNKRSREISKQVTQANFEFGVVILAAGQGKRMRSPLPKVLHEVSGTPMIAHVLRRIRESRPEASVAVVVGHARETVESFFSTSQEFKEMDITFIHQSEQKGTGHALQCVMSSSWGEARIAKKQPLLVLPGDLPLISSQMVSQISAPLKKGEAMRLLTCNLTDPTGYGRIVRKGKSGPVLRIVEQKDANERQKAIQEVAVSIYFFDSACLKRALSKLSNQNAQGEFYLTDVVELEQKSRMKIGILPWPAHEELRGINDLWELTLANQWLNHQTIMKWAKAGVKFMDPQTTLIDVSVELAEGVVIHPRTTFLGNTRIGVGTVVESGVVLKDSTVSDHVHLKVGTVAEGATIGFKAKVGPYAHLRPDSTVGAESKIGNFVELKKVSIGDHSSVAHLSYLGDAEVGSHVNIGCGFVTCNYDGTNKHLTVIEDQVFLGSDCQTVAPVRVGKGAYVASGSTITEDVPAGALAVARSRQINKPDYAIKLKKQKPKK